MQYKSTRDANNVVSSSQAILQGLASDGGLYVPVSFPKLSINWQELQDYTYQQMAYFVLSAFLDDYTEEDLKACINAAYDDKFDDPKIAPIVEVDGHYHLELFHGSTIAFKDMALSILPHLMKTAAKMTNNDNEIIILTATSGDTGKAAMAGFADVPGTKIIVFYPKGGVSSIQERQMVTQTGENTYVVAVEGNFDDAQTEVKALFNDAALREELAKAHKQFSSANSMNIGRLVPQIVYYFYAYAQLVQEGAIKAGDLVDFSVPTGNFGNILAAYYAKQIGLPIGQLICASNDNTVLYDFFQSGTYDRNREFKLTISPSMDILISSNFERMLYHALNEDTEQLKALMAALSNEGEYAIPAAAKANFADFVGEFASEAETKAEIAEVYAREQYVMDPHTSVASKCWRKLAAAGKTQNPVVVVSTASPYKFPEAVLSAVGVETAGMSDDELLTRLKEISGVEFPPAIVELKEAPVRHDLTIAVNKMKDTVVTIVNK